MSVTIRTSELNRYTLNLVIFHTGDIYGRVMPEAEVALVSNATRPARIHVFDRFHLK